MFPNLKSNNACFSKPCHSCGATDHVDSTSSLCIMFPKCKCGATDHTNANSLKCRLNKVKLNNLDKLIK